MLLKAAEENRQRDIRTILIEANPKTFASLEANVSEFRERRVPVHTMHGTVEDRLPEAMALVAGDPVLAFFDPFGVALSKEKMIDCLLSRDRSAPPSEVLININLEAVARIAGCLNDPEANLKSLAHLDMFFGDLDWRESFHTQRSEEGAKAAEAAKHLVCRYRREIRETTGYHSLSAPIRRHPDHSPLFLLTLFYRHPMAGYKFADAASRATRAWRHAYMEHEMGEAAPIQESLFDQPTTQSLLEDEFQRQQDRHDQEWIREICRNIRSLNQPHIPIATPFEAILGRTICLAGEKHIRKAWDRLAEENYLKKRPATKSLFSIAMERA